MIRFDNHPFRPSLSATRSFGKLCLLSGFLALVSGSAQGQLMLHGAMNGTAGQSSPRVSSSPDQPRTSAKPIPVRPPPEEAVLGHALSFDGSKGAMQFDRTGPNVTLTKLVLPGERLSKPGESCQVSIVAPQPIIVSDAGRPAGAVRWNIAVEACPFTVDVLDGAALVTSARPSCDFTAADCRVNPIGLWGPAGDTITAQRIKDLEHQRVRSETTMRANFRVLLHRAGKDKAAVKTIAGEQAAFSSEREMTCRDYVGETVHGFCSTQITQARSLAIVAKFADQDEDERPKGTKRPGLKKARNRPKAAIPAASADVPPAAGPAPIK